MSNIYNKSGFRILKTLKQCCVSVTSLENLRQREFDLWSFTVNPLGLLTPLRNYGGDEMVQTVDQRSRFDAMLKMDFIIHA